jgi:hypothetical protein
MADCPNCGAVHGGRAYDPCPWCLFKPREEGGYGHWTDAPAETAGWYVTACAEGDLRNCLWLDFGESAPLHGEHRWSEPLPLMPAVPSNEENSHE